jgi:hypothetical protein
MSFPMQFLPKPLFKLAAILAVGAGSAMGLYLSGYRRLIAPITSGRLRLIFVPAGFWRIGSEPQAV